MVHLLGLSLPLWAIFAFTYAFLTCAYPSMDTSTQSDGSASQLQAEDTSSQTSRSRPSTQLRVTDFLPSKFDGKGNTDIAQAHLLGFQDYLEIHGLQEPRDQPQLDYVIQLFKRTLADTARLWIHSQTFTSLDELKQNFLKRFGTNNTYYAQRRAFDKFTYQTGDSAHVHLSKLEKAAMTLDYSRDQIRDKFIDTLPPACRSAVLMTVSPETTLPDLVDKAQCYFDLNDSNVVKQKSHDQALVTQQSDDDEKIQSLCSRLEDLETNIKGRKSDAQTISNRGRSTQRRNVREPRNRSTTRPRQNFSFPPPQQEVVLPNVKCFLCGNLGHYQRSCNLNRQSDGPQPYPDSYVTTPQSTNCFPDRNSRSGYEQSQRYSQHMHRGRRSFRTPNSRDQDFR